jgi:hypothetical protein
LEANLLEEEGNAYRWGGSGVVDHLAGRVEMAYLDHQGEEGPPAFQTGEEGACLFISDRGRRISISGRAYPEYLQEKEVASQRHQLEVVTLDSLARRPRRTR